MNRGEDTPGLSIELQGNMNSTLNFGHEAAE
jgi:hypothetical protein